MPDDALSEDLTTSGAPPPATPAPSRAQRLKSALRGDARLLFSTGVPHLFAATALTQGMSILRRVLLVRILSLDDLGRMTYVMQIADFIAMLADLGICTAVLKYASEPGSDQRKRQLYFLGLVGGSLASTAVGLIYLLAVYFLPVEDNHTIWLYMLMVAPYIPLSAVVKTPLTFMQARKDIKRAARYTALTQSLGLVMLVSATYFFGLWGFFVTVIVAPLSNFAILLVATRQDLHWFRPAWRLIRKLVAFGFMSMLANATGTANVAAPVVLLHQLGASYAEVGVYSVALVVISGMRLLPMSLMQTAFPYLSGLLTDPERLRRRMRELSKKQCLAMLVVTAAWACVGSFVIHVVFGVDDPRAFRATLMLLVGLIAFALWAPAGNVLLILERVHLNFAVSLGQLLVNVALSVLWIPSYGLLGAAAAVSVAELMARIVSVLAVNATLTAPTFLASLSAFSDQDPVVM